MKCLHSWVVTTFCVLMLALPLHASTGTEGASFLDIPVGAGPAAMGAAYTALADDAYAATWNPAGLGFLDSPQFSGQHLSYIDTLHYEYLSFGLPLAHGKSCITPSECPRSALGGSVQYLGSGNIEGMDHDSNPTGTFSNYYAAYNLALGHSFTKKLSLGLAGKMISAKLADVSASAYAVDLGSMYRLRNDLTLAATLTNLGSKLTFLSEGDPLPLTFRLGVAYQPIRPWLITAEGVHTQNGLVAFHAGTEWRPVSILALRAGFRTDTLEGLSGMTGATLGVGLHVWGQELGYAWVPYGDLGDTHYISLVMKLGESENEKRNLIQYQNIKKHRSASTSSDEVTPDYQQLMEILSNGESHLAQKIHTPSEAQ